MICLVSPNRSLEPRIVIKIKWPFVSIKVIRHSPASGVQPVLTPKTPGTSSSSNLLVEFSEYFTPLILVISMDLVLTA